MATHNGIDDSIFQNANAVFTPYVEFCGEADALNVYFKGDADYAARLNAHITLFRAIDTDELVGCRIKGITELARLAPNHLNVEHDGIKLRVIFWSFQGNASARERELLQELSEKAGDLPLAI